MKQDKINMLLNVKRIMFVNMFYFLLFYLEIKTESVPVTINGKSAYKVTYYICHYTMIAAVFSRIILFRTSPIFTGQNKSARIFGTFGKSPYICSENSMFEI